MKCPCCSQETNFIIGPEWMVFFEDFTKLEIKALRGFLLNDCEPKTRDWLLLHVYGHYVKPRTRHSIPVMVNKMNIKLRKIGWVVLNISRSKHEGANYQLTKIPDHKK